MSQYILLCSLELIIVIVLIAISGFYLGKHDALSTSGNRVGRMGCLFRLGLVELFTIIAHYVINTRLLIDINTLYLGGDPDTGPEYLTINFSCCTLPLKMVFSGVAFLIAYNVGYKHYHKTEDTSDLPGTQS
jgi:hypothetical protein